jgi:hypothetical protein
MKMYSKEGQTLIDVTTVNREGENLTMKGKLMNAYSMTIYLRPEDAWKALGLLSWGVIRYLPFMLLKGRSKARKNGKA